MCPREDVEVDAFSGMFSVPASPDVGDRRTVEQASDGECNSICQADTYQAKDNLPELLPRKDAQAEEQEAYLRKRHSHKVEDLS